jgi:hypothetical protein
MIHMDLFGPVTYISICGNKYGLVIIDDYSCFTWVFFLQDKSETQEVLKKFLKKTQNEFDAKVKKIILVSLEFDAYTGTMWCSIW